jgi:small conductance mechanosensitive channel
MNDQLQTVDQIRHTAIDLAMKFGPKVVVAIIIMVAGFFVGRWVGRGADRMFKRLQLEIPVRQLLVRAIRGLVLGLFAIMALQNLGVELLPLIAGIGVAGAGIALAMQGVLSNVVAGLTIIFTKPFRVGEYISIVGVEGKVENISLFSTVLSHTDLSRVVIPNRKIVGEILHNYGTIRQVQITVGVAYDTEVSHALAVIDEVLKNNPRVLKDPVPVIGVAVLADSSVNIAVRPWTNVMDYVAVSAEINRAILESFRGRNIVIPFPQQEVRILSNAA